MAKVEMKDAIQEIVGRVVDQSLGNLEGSLSRTKENLLGVLGEWEAVQKLLGASNRQDTCNRLVQEVSALIQDRNQEMEASKDKRFSSLIAAGNQMLSGSGQAEILYSLLQGAALYAGRSILFLTRGENICGWKTAGVVSFGESQSVESLQMSKDAENIVARACQEGTKLEEHPDGQCLCAHPLLQAIPGRDPENMVAIPIRILGKCPAILYADHHPSDAVPFDLAALEFLASLTQNKIELQALLQVFQSAEVQEVKAYAGSPSIPDKKIIAPAPDEPIFSEPEPAPVAACSLAPEEEGGIAPEPPPVSETSPAEAGETRQDLLAQVPPTEEMEPSPEIEAGKIEPVLEEPPQSREPEASLEDFIISEPVEETIQEVEPEPIPIPEAVITLPEDESVSSAEEILILPVEENLPETIKMPIPTLTEPSTPLGAASDSTFSAKIAEDEPSDSQRAEAAIFSFTPEDEESGPVQMTLQDFLQSPQITIPPPAPKTEEKEALPPPPEPSVPEKTVLITPAEKANLSVAPAITEFLSAPDILTQQPKKEPPAPAAPAPTPEAEKALLTGSTVERLHADARRFARLLVSEIKLYNEQILVEARRNQNIYRQLRKAIDLSREHYSKRVSQSVSENIDYFHEELVRMLCEGNASLLGPEYPGPVTASQK